jgi:hypothetical protein
MTTVISNKYNQCQTVGLLVTKNIPYETVEIINSFLLFHKYMTVHKERIFSVNMEIACKWSCTDSITYRRYCLGNGPENKGEKGICMRCARNLSKCLTCEKPYYMQSGHCC